MDERDQYGGTVRHGGGPRVRSRRGGPGNRPAPARPARGGHHARALPTACRRRGTRPRGLLRCLGEPASPRRGRLRRAAEAVAVGVATAALVAGLGLLADGAAAARTAERPAEPVLTVMPG